MTLPCNSLQRCRLTPRIIELREYGISFRDIANRRDENDNTMQSDVIEHSFKNGYQQITLPTTIST